MAEIAHEGHRNRLKTRRRVEMLAWVVAAVTSLLQLERKTVAATPPVEDCRGCPNCEESMRRDVRECPQCGTVSEPWIYRLDRWWIRDGGTWLWLDEARGEWIPHYYATPPAAL